jgi:hypothetical protein
LDNLEALRRDRKHYPWEDVRQWEQWGLPESFWGGPNDPKVAPVEISETEVWKEYLEMLRQVVEGERELPALKMHKRGQEIHLSDLQNCPAVAFWNRKSDPTLFPLDDRSVIRFFRGRILERAMSQEVTPLAVDGIICTPDGFRPDTKQLVEIKSTAHGISSFRVDTMTEWKERMAGYAHAHCVNSVHLVVLFIAGNMSDWMTFVVKQKGIPRDRYIPVGMKSWLFKFSVEYVRKTWDDFIIKKNRLDEALKTEDINLLLTPHALRERPGWQCKLCRYNAICPASTWTEGRGNKQAKEVDPESE